MNKIALFSHPATNQCCLMLGFEASFDILFVAAKVLLSPEICDIRHDVSLYPD